MKDFANFLNLHREQIERIAEQNTFRNENGDTVISESDPWFYEDEWDEYYEELTANG